MAQILTFRKLLDYPNCRSVFQDMTMSLSRPRLGLAVFASGAALVAATRWALGRRFRCAALRRHRWGWVRGLHTVWAVHSFARRLELACRALPAPLDATAPLDGGGAVLAAVLAEGVDTFQRKPSNLAQISSLLECVCGLLPAARARARAAAVVDLGAGKALLTRAVYEALRRQTACVALDTRRESAKDLFYDPRPPAADGDAPYARVVGDVGDLARLELPLPPEARGGVVVIAKHLCGSATDAGLRALCAPDGALAAWAGACCIAPCCHQKARPAAHCNRRFLAERGFGADDAERTRGGAVSEREFRTLTMLVQISRAADARGFAGYKRSNFLRVLGFRRCRELGRLARRLLEEGRLRYLREHGWDARLVRYVDASVTPDNLAIIATKR